jgi:hypothetical protein
MAWIREYNVGQKGVGERWSVVSGRPDATNNITWAGLNIWTGIVWAKEVKSSASFILESNVTLKELWNTTLSNWEDTNQGRWNSGWLKES